MLTHETFRHPDGTYRYRLLQDGTHRLTSGGFLLQRDADACGRHITTDADAAAYLKDTEK